MLYFNSNREIHERCHNNWRRNYRSFRSYFLSKAGRKVKVFERDPTYKSASFPLPLGGFGRQFFQKENILLGKFGFKVGDLTVLLVKD